MMVHVWESKRLSQSGNNSPVVMKLKKGINIQKHVYCGVTTAGFELLHSVDTWVWHTERMPNGKLPSVLNKY